MWFLNLLSNITNGLQNVFFLFQSTVHRSMEDNRKNTPYNFTTSKVGCNFLSPPLFSSCHRLAVLQALLLKKRKEKPEQNTVCTSFRTCTSRHRVTETSPSLQFSHNSSLSRHHLPIHPFLILNTTLRQMSLTIGNVPQ